MVHGFLLGSALRCGTSLAIEASRANRERQLLQNGAYMPVTSVVAAPTPVPPDPNQLRGSKLCAIVSCMTFLFIIVLPVFITSMVLFGYANGDHDAERFEYEYDDCSWSPWYRRSLGENNMYTDETDCEEGKRKFDKWEEKKAELKVWAVVTLVAFLLSLTIATSLSIFLCVRNCSDNRGGLIHQEYAPSMTTPPRPQIVSPVINPMQPPAYSTVVSHHQYQYTQPVPQVHQQIQQVPQVHQPMGGAGYANPALASKC